MIRAVVNEMIVDKCIELRVVGAAGYVTAAAAADRRAFLQ